MPPIVKDSAISQNAPGTTPPGRSPQPFGRREDAPPRPQPVCLEVPVTVNGVRTLDDSDKREPFSENTRTVLVFAHGAVLRLATAVSPGQLLFITNERTKKEIVCQVVKSKNYRNVSGYVELEFTEPAVGFWGMRFPGDKLGPGNAAGEETLPATGVENQQPPLSALPLDSAAHPAPVAVDMPRIVPLISSGNVSAASLPRAADVQKAPSVARLPKVTLPPPASLPTKIEPPAPEPGSGASANGNEQAGEVPTIAAASLDQLLGLMEEEQKQKKSAIPQPDASVLAADLFELEADTPAPPASEIKASPAALIAPSTGNPTREASAPQAKPSVYPLVAARALPQSTERKPAAAKHEEEAPLPAWLTPAAYTSLATPVRPSTAGSGSKGVTPHTTDLDPIPVKDFIQHTAEAEVPSAPSWNAVASDSDESAAFGSQLFLQEEKGSEPARAGGGKLLVYGAIAALVLASLAGGGWWYMRSATSRPMQAAVAPNPAPAVALGVASNPVSQAGSLQTAPVTSSATLPSSTSSAAPLVQPSSTVNTSGRVVMPSLEESRTTAKSTTAPATPPAAPQAKKSLLEKMHLSAPVVSRRAAPTVGTDVEPNFGSMPNVPVSGEATRFVAPSGNQPAAPKSEAAVGGNVKPAKLISTAVPVYPPLARTQRISGNVVIDALIEANGHVTSMKVLSGHPLLQQAAMDSLRQWKYQPALLDGKPVPMHLTVTVQFRLQR
jgi:protein TonB